MTDDFENDDENVEHEAELAAGEAAHIGGPVSDEEPHPDGDDPDRAVREGGEGESEGFEEAEQQQIDHTSHGDQHAAGRIIEDAAREDE